MAQPERKPLPKPGFLVGDMPKEPFTRRRAALYSERSPFMDEWISITDFVRPRRGRYLVTDRDRPRSFSKIINNTATVASRTLAAGMMGGCSSPARPWFKLKTSDDDLNDAPDVKEYLSAVANKLQLVFAKSNFYNTLHTLYGDLGDFGTGSMVMDADFQDVIRCTGFAPGEYYIAVGERGSVNTLYRDTSYSVLQMVERWGDRVSRSVMNMYDRSDYDTQILVCSAIEPNMQQVQGLPGPIGMPFIAATFETAGDYDKLLDRKGYNSWPAPCPRWEVMSGDSWGNGPGLDARGDSQALQGIERKKAIGIDKMMTPPVQRPPSLANDPVSHMAGGVTTVSETSRASAGIRPIYEIKADGINAVGLEIQRHEHRINTAYYADLFLMLSQSDRREITAREIDERHEEKLLALGPVLDRLHNELLNVCISRAYQIMSDASGYQPDGTWKGVLPEPPKVLQGIDIKIEYISILAQAQRAVSTGGIEKVAGFVGSLAAANPAAIDKINMDQMIDDYADNVGIPPKIIVPTDEANKIRADRAQKQQQMAQTEQLATLAKAGADSAAAGKVLSETPGAAQSIQQVLGTGAAPT